MCNRHQEIERERKTFCIECEVPKKVQWCCFNRCVSSEFGCIYVKCHLTETHICKIFRNGTQMFMTREFSPLQCPRSSFAHLCQIHYSYVGPILYSSWPTKVGSWVFVNQTTRIANSSSPAATIRHKTVTWRYLRNQVWYHRSAGVRTNRKNYDKKIQN